MDQLMETITKNPVNCTYRVYS